MPIEIRMPRLTDSMTEGVVVAWRKSEGEPVRAGEVIAEIQADKTTVDFEAPADGTLGRIVTPAGADAVKVGDILAFVHEPGDVPSSAANGVTVSAAAVTKYTTTQSEETAGPTMTIAPADIEATPLARSMAAQAGIDLSRLSQTGPRGRVTMARVLTELGGVEPRPGKRFRNVDSVPTPIPESSAIDAPYDEVPHSPMRQVIARRLSAAKQSIPHFYLTTHCEIDALLHLKAELQPQVKGELKLSINDFLIRATALALRAVPEANASWTDGATRFYKRVDVAIAVATESGLITPVIRNAGRKGIAEIALEVRDLASRARSGWLRPEEYQGGTFTLSNLGMYDVDEICAIINPPQAGILGTGKAAPRPVAREGSVVVATMMTCTLSADHRILDGAVGAKFLSTFKSLVERPTTMIL
jgi:pyruvate dehydrogenase E2 component (dihydrolipoamide acetyltransferase)